MDMRWARYKTLDTGSMESGRWGNGHEVGQIQDIRYMESEEWEVGEWT